MYSERPWSTVFSELARAERGHARTVFDFLRDLEAVEEDFEAVFDRLPGDVLEGGMTLDTALQKVAAVKGRICLYLIELALQLENQAYDLYRATADQTIESHAREAFWTLAQAEKGHMRSLAGAIGGCSRDV